MATPLNTSGLLQVDGAGGGSTSTLSAGFTFTAGNDAVFECAYWDVTGTDPANIASVTIGGTAATLVARARNGAFRSEQWIANNIVGGTQNVAITFGAASSGNYLSGGVQEWDAADNLTYDTGTANNATGTGTEPSVSTATTTSQADTVVIACLAPGTSSSSSNITGPTGWTALWTEQDDSNHIAGRGSYHEETAAGTKTATFGQASGGWAVTIAAYTVASGAATHATSGSLTGAGSSLAGTSVHRTLHSASGALTGPGASFSGTATNFTVHASAGVLVGSGAVLTGAAAHSVPAHEASGALVGAGASFTGVALRYRQHAATGVLLGQGAVVTGSALRFRLHAASGALTGQGALLSGVSGRFRVHTSSGELAGAVAALSGTAAVTTAGEFISSGVLAGQGSEIVGAALRYRVHASSGTLVGSGAALAASAAHHTIHNTSGVLLGPAAVLEGVAGRVGAPVEHSTSGVLVGIGSSLSGLAALGIAQPSSIGGWFPAPRPARAERDEERRKLGILPAEVVAKVQPTQTPSRKRTKAERAARRLFAGLPKAVVEPSATYTLPAAPPEPTMATDVSASVVDPALLAAQRKRAFEQDLVYIVATLIS